MHHYPLPGPDQRIQAALELHRPVTVDDYDLPVCAQCGDEDGFTVWPCATAQTLEPTPPKEVTPGRTPPTSAIRDAFVRAHPFRRTTEVEDRYAEFDRWLATTQEQRGQR